MLATPDRPTNSRLIGRTAQWSAPLWLGCAAVIVAFSWIVAVRFKDQTGPLLVPIIPAAALTLIILLTLRAGSSRVSMHFLAGLALFVMLSGFDAVRCSYRPEGDEPWYLSMADSIVQDGDLDVPPDELAQRSAWYYGSPLPPEQTYKLAGHHRIAHWPGLSFYLAPACILRSVFLARLEMALLMSVAAAMGSRLLGRYWQDERVGVLSIAFLMLETPHANYSLMIFPDEAASALFLIALALLVDRSPAKAILGGLLAGTLPWLKLPFVVLTAACGLLALVWRIRDGRGLRGALWPLVASIATMAPLIWFQLPRFSTEALLEKMNAVRAPWLFGQSLIEPGRGLLVHYPACLFLLVTTAGLIFWLLRPSAWASDRRIKSVASLAAILCASSVIGMTAILPGVLPVAGWCPPGRYWMPTLTVFLVVIASERDLVLPVGRRLLQLTTVRLILIPMLCVGLATNVILTIIPRVAFTDGPHWIHRLRHPS